MAQSCPSASANKRRRQQGDDFQEKRQKAGDDAVELPCLSFREPFCSLLLNNYKVLETRKWPVLAETNGPIGIHCAFHDWDGIEEARENVRQHLGENEAAKALQMPSNMQRGAVVGVAYRVGRTWTINTRTDTDAHTEEGHGNTETAAAKAHAKLQEEDEEWLRSVRAEEGGEGGGHERLCDLVLCHSCSGGGSGEGGGGAVKRTASLAALERQALLAGLEGKSVTAVFGAAWLLQPLPIRGAGGLFPVRIPRALFSAVSLSRLSRPVSPPHLQGSSVGTPVAAEPSSPQSPDYTLRLRDSSLPLVEPFSPRSPPDYERASLHVCKLQGQPEIDGARLSQSQGSPPPRPRSPRSSPTSPRYSTTAAPNEYCPTTPPS